MDAAVCPAYRRRCSLSRNRSIPRTIEHVPHPHSTPTRCPQSVQPCKPCAAKPRRHSWDIIHRRSIELYVAGSCASFRRCDALASPPPDRTRLAWTKHVERAGLPGSVGRCALEFDRTWSPLNMPAEVVQEARSFHGELQCNRRITNGILETFTLRYIMCYGDVVFQSIVT